MPSSPRTGEPSPAGGVYSHLAWQPSIDDAGRVVFAASLRDGASSSGQGLFLSDAQGTRALVLRGPPAPRGGAFLELVASDHSSYVTGHRLHLDARGRVAFLAGLDVGATRPAFGLFVHDGSAVREVVRTGDPLDGRTVVEIAFGSVVSPGVLAFDDACRIAFRVLHDDGSYALWRMDGCAAGPS